MRLHRGSRFVVHRTQHRRLLRGRQLVDPRGRQAEHLEVHPAFIHRRQPHRAQIEQFLPHRLHGCRHMLAIGTGGLQKILGNKVLFQRDRLLGGHAL